MFLSFPPEIRQMVYDYALIVGNVMPYLKSYEAAFGDKSLAPLVRFCGPPNISLLETCRLVYAEASRTLYSKNTFMLPTTWVITRFFARALHTPTRRSWVKSVYLKFEFGDLFRLERNELYLGFIRDTLGEDQERCQELRDWGFRAFCRVYTGCVCWPRLVNLILENLVLVTLKVDFFDCFPLDLHRDMEAHALLAFQKGFAHGMPADFKAYGLSVLSEEKAEETLQTWTKQRHEASVSLRQGFETVEWLLNSNSLTRLLWREVDPGL